MQIANLKKEPKHKNGLGGSLATVITEKQMYQPPIFFPFFILTYNDTHFGAK